MTFCSSFLSWLWGGSHIYWFVFKRTSEKYEIQKKGEKRLQKSKMVQSAKRLKLSYSDVIAYVIVGAEQIFKDVSSLPQGYWISISLRRYSKRSNALPTTTKLYTACIISLKLKLIWCWMESVLRKV